jgi:hypothetical protein
MAKLVSFARLDFMTVKPYFTGKNLIVYAAIALFISSVSGNAAAGLGVGMMLGTMFVSYPFAVGEKSNMDALYVTLSVNRSTVVLGRYFFAFAMNVCAVLFSLALAFAGVFISRTLDLRAEETNMTDVIGGMAALAVVFIAVQAVQLPILFKFGYTKAKFLSQLPFIGMMAAFFIFLAIGQNIGAFQGNSPFAAAAGNVRLIALFTLLGLLLIVAASARLSLLFYRKRGF